MGGGRTCEGEVEQYGTWSVVRCDARRFPGPSAAWLLEAGGRPAAATAAWKAGSPVGICNRVAISCLLCIECSEEKEEH